MQTAVLTKDYARHHMARSVPGAYYEDKAWVLDDPTPRAAAITLRMFPELAIEYPWLEDIRDQLVQDVRPFDNATPYGKRVAALDVYRSLAAEGKDFFDFQAIDLGYVADVLDTHGGAYIGWERGLGKTLGSCALIDALDAEQVLVVCPNTAKDSVWGDELRRWLPNHEVVVLGNTAAHRTKSLGKFVQLRENHYPAVLVVHYEALAVIAGKGTKKGRGSVPLGKGWDKYGTWDLVIADEAHRVKNPKAQMSRALKKVPATAKVALSGSIIQNHADELFSPLQWLFPDRYKAQWRDWNDRFLDYIDGPFGKVCIGVKLEALEDLRHELGVFMVYRRKEDELDLPARTDQTLFVDLSVSQRQAYNDLLASCQAELADGTTLKAADGLVMLGRLRQIATGLDLLGDLTDSTKLDLACDLIADAEDDAFVVFGWFKASCRALADRLEQRGIGCFVVDGDVPAARRSEFIARFQGGECRVFIGTLSTLSESVTLTRASNAILLDRSWNPATNVQAEDRIYRIGQDKPVTITHIVAKDTVDELRVTPTLANKEALRSLILGGK